MGKTKNPYAKYRERYTSHPPDEGFPEPLLAYQLLELPGKKDRRHDFLFGLPETIEHFRPPEK